MRKYLHFDLATLTVREEQFSGEQVAHAGRYLIAKMLNEMGVAEVAPLAPENPLIFSAGPFAGSNWSNANRTSVGCKSPLTGGIKEANAGGSFGLAMGQLHLAGFTLHGAAADWTVIRMTKDGAITFASGNEYLGLGTFECARRLHEKYGKKVSLALCGPVGEYQGLLAGISFSDTDRRPSRLAARGGVGAVMGMKKNQGHRARPRSPAHFSRPQESAAGHKTVRCAAAGRRGDQNVSGLWHGGDGRLHQSGGGAARE